MTVIIQDPDHGVFVGMAMGFAFWTGLDCAGQQHVCTFETESEARDFANTILQQGMNVNSMTFVEIDTNRPYATAKDLLRAGLEEPANALMREQLKNMDTRDFLM